MRNIISILLKEFVEEVNKTVRCEDIKYSDSKMYGSKGYTQKFLKSKQVINSGGSKIYVGPMIKKDDEIDKMCNCCKDGNYVRSIECEDKYIEYLGKKILDQNVGEFIWLKPNCSVRKKTNKGKSNDGSAKIKNIITDTSLTSLQDDLTSYNFEKINKPPQPNIIFRLFGNIIEETFNILKPHEYKFYLGEVIGKPENFKEKTINFFTNYEKWYIIIKIKNLTTESSTDEEKYNLGAFIKGEIFLYNAKGKKIASMSIDATGNFSIKDNIPINITLENINLTSEIETYLLNIDLEIDTDGILHIKKGFVDIPINIKKYINYEQTIDLPIPKKVPFDVEISQNKKTLIAEISKGTVFEKISIGNEILSYTNKLEFESSGGKVEETKKNFLTKIFESLIMESTGNLFTGVCSLEINYSVFQNLIDVIGNIEFSHTLDELMVNQTIDPKLNFVWDKIKNFEVKFIIGNCEISYVSLNTFLLRGEVTLKTNKLFAIRKDNEDGYIFDFDTNLDGDYVQQKIPFSAYLSIENQGEKIELYMKSLILNIHKLFKLGINQKRGEVYAEFDYLPNGKDSEIEYGISKTPLKIGFDFPKSTEVRSFGVKLGTNDLKEVSIKASNTYEVNLTETSVNGVSSFFLFNTDSDIVTIN